MKMSTVVHRLQFSAATPILSSRISPHVYTYLPLRLYVSAVNQWLNNWADVDYFNVARYSVAVITGSFEAEKSLPLRVMIISALAFNHNNTALHPQSH